MSIHMLLQIFDDLSLNLSLSVMALYESIMFSGCPFFSLSRSIMPFFRIGHCLRWSLLEFVTVYDDLFFGLSHSIMVICRVYVGWRRQISTLYTSALFLDRVSQIKQKTLGQ